MFKAIISHQLLRVLIAGASGLVGQHLLRYTGDVSVTEVLTLGRRPQP